MAHFFKKNRLNLLGSRRDVRGEPLERVQPDPSRGHRLERDQHDVARREGARRWQRGKPSKARPACLVASET